jgi:heat shock protein HslJ
MHYCLLDLEGSLVASSTGGQTMKQFTQSGIFMIALCLCALCAACVAPPSNHNNSLQESASSELAGSKWRLLQLGEPAVTPDAEITVTFSADRLLGHSGCNDYSGSYQLTGDTIRISNTEVTTMACKETLRMTQEALYLEMLTKVNKFKVQSQQLELFDDQEKPVLIFAAIAANS